MTTIIRVPKIPKKLLKNHSGDPNYDNAHDTSPETDPPAKFEILHALLLTEIAHDRFKDQNRTSGTNNSQRLTRKQVIHTTGDGGTLK